MRSLPVRPRRTTKLQKTRIEKALTTFTELGALPEVVDALDRVGISEPFPIQTMAIPIGLLGTDLIAQARTGTGKTLAFGIPVLQRIVARNDREYADHDSPGKPQALVIAPTRELALQVADDLAVAGSIREVRILTVYGGVPYEPQLDTLARGVDVVVGTPGRLLDLANRGSLVLSHVKVLVLDEADRMLDLGFLPDVERLIAKTHELRQTMLFSATMPGDIVQLARRHMRHPLNVRAESAEDSQMVPATAQFVYRAHDLDKPEVIARILQAEDRGRVMVFCETKRAAQRLSDDLAERGFAATAIHGDLGQGAREKALERFRGNKVDVLVATDVAARGIDVEGVTHVINNECPDDEKTYLHRIGRTGRAGASGVAVTFVDWPDMQRWKMINNALKLPFDEPVETYSTSEHLFSELGIPKDATGTVGPPKARSKRRSEERPARSSERSERSSERSERPARKPDRSRQRRRLRGGVPIEGEGAADAPATESAAEEGAPRRKRVRRRKRASSDPTPTEQG